MRKIAVVITARPSYARIKSVLQAIQEHPDLSLYLVLAASALLERYGNVAEVIKADGFEPVAEIDMVVEGGTPLVSAKTLGLGVIELANTFHHLKPDCVLTVADRYETLATAIAAAYMNIPVAHVQGGEVSGSIDEKVRHAVTKLADLHMVANASALSRVTAMGETQVFNTGCPAIDLAAAFLDYEDWSVVRQHTAHGVGAEIDSYQGDYIIAMQHPVTYEWDHAFDQAWATLEAVHLSGLPCFWFWPNIDAGSDGTSKAIRLFREQYNAQIRFLRNMPPEPFLMLLHHAKVIVGNSSAAIREGAYLGTPAVNIGSRQLGRDCATNVSHIKDFDCDRILAAIQSQSRTGRYPSSKLYGDGNAGPKIAALLANHPLTTEKRFADRQ